MSSKRVLWGDSKENEKGSGSSGPSPHYEMNVCSFLRRMKDFHVKSYYEEEGCLIKRDSTCLIFCWKESGNRAMSRPVSFHQEPLEFQKDLEGVLSFLQGVGCIDRVKELKELFNTG